MYNNNKIKHEVVIFFFIMGKTFRICEFHNYEQWIIFADDMFKHWKAEEMLSREECKKSQMGVMLANTWKQQSPFCVPSQAFHMNSC